MLLYFETLPKQNGCGFISKYFALNLKLIEYLTYVAIVVLSNPRIGLLPITKIFYLLLLVCNDERLSILNSIGKVITFLPKPNIEMEKVGVN